MRPIHPGPGRKWGKKKVEKDDKTDPDFISRTLCPFELKLLFIKVINVDFPQFLRCFFFTYAVSPGDKNIRRPGWDQCWKKCPSGSDSQQSLQSPRSHVTVISSSWNNSCLWFHGKLEARFLLRWQPLTTPFISAVFISLIILWKQTIFLFLPLWRWVTLSHDFTSQTLRSKREPLNAFIFATLYSLTLSFYPVLCCHSLSPVVGCVCVCVFAYVHMKPSSCLLRCCAEMISGDVFMMPAWLCSVGTWIHAQDQGPAFLHPQPFPAAIPAPSHKNDAVRPT